jgi:hypothetical protein
VDERIINTFAGSRFQSSSFFFFSTPIVIAIVCKQPGTIHHHDVGDQAVLVLQVHMKN